MLQRQRGQSGQSFETVRQIAVQGTVVAEVERPEIFQPGDTFRDLPPDGIIVKGQGFQSGEFAEFRRQRTAQLVIVQREGAQFGKACDIVRNRSGEFVDGEIEGLQPRQFADRGGNRA